MDAREWDQPQFQSQPPSRRSSIKRPWDEESNLPQGSSSWSGSLLPPIGDVPYRRPSFQHAIEPPLLLRYIPDERELAAKRARYEGDDYRSLSRDDLGLNSEAPQSRRLSRTLNRC